ncbi:hypothetical protein AYI70_g6782, partial [Smittium culicis]
MNDKNNKKISFGYKNSAPARNSTVFLPHIPGKNYENPSEIDDISFFESESFDDCILSDEFTYDVSDCEEELETVPTAMPFETDIITSDNTDTFSAETDAASSASAVSAHASCASASSDSASSVAASSASASSVSASSASASSVSASSASASSVSASSASASSGSASSVAALSVSAVSAPASSSSASSASATSVAACSVLDSLLASVQSSSASSSCNKRKRGPEPKSIGQLVPGPSYCATKKKPVKRPLSSRLSVITYPVKTYKKPVVPKTVPLAASGSSGGPTNGPIANISAAIACSSFTPTEYAKK